MIRPSWELLAFERPGERRISKRLAFSLSPFTIVLTNTTTTDLGEWGIQRYFSSVQDVTCFKLSDSLANPNQPQARGSRRGVHEFTALIVRRASDYFQ